MKTVVCSELRSKKTLDLLADGKLLRVSRAGRVIGYLVPRPRSAEELEQFFVEVKGAMFKEQ